MIQLWMNSPCSAACKKKKHAHRDTKSDRRTGRNTHTHPHTHKQIYADIAFSDPIATDKRPGMQTNISAINAASVDLPCNAVWHQHIFIRVHSRMARYTVSKDKVMLFSKASAHAQMRHEIR